MNGASVEPIRAISLLQRLVDIDTPSGHAPGLREAFALLRGVLSPILGAGIVVEEDAVPHLVWEPAEGRSKVLLLGHVDTVWPLGTVATRPFSHRGDRALGPGVFDMKAGLVIAAEALALSRDVSGVSMLITGDEEVGSRTSRGLIEHLASRSDAVLVLEPSLDGALKTARKGAAMYQLRIAGRGAHAGLEPERGVNALDELAGVIAQIESLAGPALGTTVTPTLARGGEAINAVPAYAELNLDVRAWTPAELNRVDRMLPGLALRHPEASLEVLGGINRYPMEPEQSSRLVEKAKLVAAELGLDAVQEARAGGASDGNFTAALGVPTLDGLGAIGGSAHRDDEWIEVSSLTQRARLVAGLIDALQR